MNKKIFMIVIVLLFQLPFNVFAGWTVYDDFNSANIDTDKWTVSQGNIDAGNGPFQSGGALRIDLGNDGGVLSTNDILANQTLHTEVRGVRVTLKLPGGSANYMDWMTSNVKFFVSIRLAEFDGAPAPIFKITYSVNGTKAGPTPNYIDKYGSTVELYKNNEWVTYFDATFKPEENQAVFELIFDKNKALARNGNRGALFQTEGFDDICTTACDMIRVNIGLSRFNPDTNGEDLLGSVTIEKVELYYGTVSIPAINSLLLLQ